MLCERADAFDPAKASLDTFIDRVVNSAVGVILRNRQRLKRNTGGPVVSLDDTGNDPTRPNSMAHGLSPEHLVRRTGHEPRDASALTHWREVIDQLNLLRSQRGMVVVLIAHAKVEKFEDPEAPPYDRYSPRLHKHASALVSEWCDAVLFATRKFRTQSEDAGFGRKRTIAHAIGKDGGERVLHTIGGPSCVAKNRYGLTEELPLSWAAFMTALTTHQPNDPTTEEPTHG